MALLHRLMAISAVVMPLSAALVATTPAPDEATTPVPKALSCMAIRALCSGSDEGECIKKLNKRLDEHRLKRQIVLVTTPAPDEGTTLVPKALSCMAIRALCSGSDEGECIKKLNRRLDEHRLKRQTGTPPDVDLPPDSQRSENPEDALTTNGVSSIDKSLLLKRIFEGFNSSAQ